MWRILHNHLLRKTQSPERGSNGVTPGASGSLGFKLWSLGQVLGGRAACSSASLEMVAVTCALPTRPGWLLLLPSDL